MSAPKRSKFIDDSQCEEEIDVAVQSTSNCGPTYNPSRSISQAIETATHAVDINKLHEVVSRLSSPSNDERLDALRLVHRWALDPRDGHLACSAFIKAGATDKLVALLTIDPKDVIPNVEPVEQVLLIVNALCKHVPSAPDELVHAGMYRKLTTILSKLQPKLRSRALNVIAYIGTARESQIDDLIESSFIDTLASLCGSSSRTEQLWLSLLVGRLEYSNFKAFFTSSTLNVVKEALNLSKEVEIITTALDNLRSLVSKLTGNHLREFVDLLDTNAVTGVIERLKTHEDDNIYLRAVHLLNEYPNMRFPNLLPQADIMGPPEPVLEQNDCTKFVF